MVERLLPYFKNIFAACAEWTGSLLDAVGGSGIVLASFIVTLSIGLLFIPMRGRMGATSFVADYQHYKYRSTQEKRRQERQQRQSSKKG